jgi:hypothetical protein
LGRTMSEAALESRRLREGVTHEHMGLGVSVRPDGVVVPRMPDGLPLCVGEGPVVALARPSSCRPRGSGPANGWRRAMRIFGKGANEQSSEENAHVRQYRFLLTTANAKQVVRLNASALASLDRHDRAEILGVVQEQLLAGGRLSPDHVDEMARLLSLGERRRPGAVVRNTPQGPLSRLAAAAVRSPEAVGLMTGYENWDGLDPEPASDEQLDPDFARPGHSGEDHYNIVKGRADGGFST